MRKQPIHLNSSKQAKLRASRSKSAQNQQSSLSIHNNVKLNESIHSIKTKKSPNKLVDQTNLPMNTTLVKSQTFTTFVTKTIRPEEIRSPLKTMHPLTHTKNTKSYYQIPKPHGIKIINTVKSSSHQKQNKNFSPFKKEITQSVTNNSPIKAIQQNQKSFIKVVELGKIKSPVKCVHPPIRMINPSKIVKEVVYQLTPKEIELERKVKILQMRISQLHNEKNMIEAKMNEMNIRLQYENNFLRQKLNKFPSNKNIRPFDNAQCLVKTVSSQQVQINNQEKQFKQIRTSCPQKIDLTEVQSSPKQTEKLSKSSDGFFQKSKQVQSLKQQLLETEEMLSKQIEKSLKLLEQLSLKQKENQSIKSEVKVLNEKIQEKDKKILDIQTEFKRLEDKLVELESGLQEMTVQVLTKNAYISGLQDKVVEIKTFEDKNKVNKELYDEIEQNNQILMSAMTTLERSFNQSQIQNTQLVLQRARLEEEVYRLQAQLREKKSKLEEKQVGDEFIKEKMDETQLQIRNSHNKLETFELLVEEKNEVIEEKEREILQKQLMIQKLEEKLHQFESCAQNLQNSSKVSSRGMCTKCGELRRTVIRLNSYLNNNSNQFSRDSKMN